MAHERLCGDTTTSELSFTVGDKGMDGCGSKEGERSTVAWGEGSKHEDGEKELFRGSAKTDNE